MPPLDATETGQPATGRPCPAPISLPRTTCPDCHAVNGLAGRDYSITPERRAIWREYTDGRPGSQEIVSWHDYFLDQVLCGDALAEPEHVDPDECWRDWLRCQWLRPGESDYQHPAVFADLYQFPTYPIAA